MVLNPVLSLWLFVPVCAAVVIFALICILKNKGIRKRLVLRTALLIAVISQVTLIELRPMRKKYETEVETRNIDVLFVLDSTMSMYVSDMPGGKERMDAAREDIVHITELLQGANFGLVVYDNIAHVMLPFTQEESNVKDALEVIDIPSVYYANGTSLTVPVEETKKLLQSSVKKDERITVLVFMSDGEVTGEPSFEEYKEIASLPDKVLVLGYGSEEGGKVYDENGRPVYSSDGEIGISKYSGENMSRLAKELNGVLIHRNDVNSVEKENAFAESVLRSGYSMSGYRKAVTYEDTYYYYVPFLILLLALVYAESETGKRRKAGHGGERGVGKK